MADHWWSSREIGNLWAASHLMPLINMGGLWWSTKGWRPLLYANTDQEKMAAEDTPQDVADRERIFKRFDVNGDGKISATEFGDTLKSVCSVTPEEVERMMDEIDTDRDGFISFEELTEFARANRGLIRDVAKLF
ncbi:Polcalcin Nic t 2 [Ancistrocladus abbreviatus]